MEAKGIQQVSVSFFLPRLLSNSPKWEHSNAINTQQENSAPAVSADDNLEKTIAIIKPDAMSPSTIEKILEIFKHARFNILDKKKIWFTKAQAQQFYFEHQSRPYFEHLVNFLSWYIFFWGA